jgi:hypothetical protein
VHLAQQTFFKSSGAAKRFASSLTELAGTAGNFPSCHPYANGCSPETLQRAVEYVSRNIFTVNITVVENASQLSAKCTQRPCYNAIVLVHPPSAEDSAGKPAAVQSAGGEYAVGVNENQYMWYERGPGRGLGGCL